MRRWPALGAVLTIATSVVTTAAATPAGAATRYLDVMFQVDVQRDVVYGTADAPDGSGATVELKLDVYTPRGDTERNRAVFLYAHGGAFIVGNKSDNDPTGWATRMAQRGYVAMSVEYRLGPNVVVPPVDAADRAQINRARFDMQTAVRWTKAHATSLGVDPDRIAVAGSSAGAITALGVALDSNQADSVPPLAGPWGEFSSSACGAVSISGANDAGAADAGDAGAIFFHGTQDGLVPYELAVVTRDAMQLADLPVEWHEYPEGHVDQFSAATRDDVRARTIQWVYDHVANAPYPCSAAVATRVPVPAGQQTVIRGLPGRSAAVALFVVDSTGPGYVQVLPCGSTPGATANLNTDAAGQTRSAVAIVKFDADGRACVFNQTRAHLVADLQGYFAPGAFEDLPDARSLDTRTSAGVPAAGSITTINGRPDSTAVVSLVATETAGPGFVQILPCGTTPGATANLNADRDGQTRGNLAFVRFDSTGRACIYQQMQTHLVVDLQGYMVPDAFNDLADTRLFDSRSRAPFAPYEEAIISGGPDTTALVSLVAVEPQAAGYLQVLPCGQPAGGSANVYYDSPGAIVGSLAFIRIPATGFTCLIGNVAGHRVADLQGTMSAGAFDDVADVRLLDTRIR